MQLKKKFSRSACCSFIKEKIVLNAGLATFFSIFSFVFLLFRGIPFARYLGFDLNPPPMDAPKVTASIIGLFFIPLGVWLNYIRIYRTKQQIDLSEKFDRERRFNDAVASLKEPPPPKEGTESNQERDDGPQSLENWGAVRTLIDITLENPKKYYISTMQVFSEFLRLKRKTARNRRDIELIFKFYSGRNNDKGVGKEYYREEFKKLEEEEEKKHGKDYRVLYLKRAYLDGLQIPGHDLSSAYAVEINLAGADLREVNFSNSNLTGAQLKKAKLEEAKLEKCLLTYADLVSVNLSNAIMKNADLADVNLSNAIMKNADLADVNLSNAIMKNADLHRANLQNTNFYNAILWGSNLHMSRLEGANLSRAGLLLWKPLPYDVRWVDLSNGSPLDACDRDFLNGIEFEDEALATTEYGLPLTDSMSKSHLPNSIDVSGATLPGIHPGHFDNNGFEAFIQKCHESYKKIYSCCYFYEENPPKFTYNDDDDMEKNKEEALAWGMNALSREEYLKRRQKKEF